MRNRESQRQFLKSSKNSVFSCGSQDQKALDCAVGQIVWLLYFSCKLFTVQISKKQERNVL